MAMRTDIRKEIWEYVYGSIVPGYSAFDPAHRQDHAMTVITQAMCLYDNSPEGIRQGLDPEVIFVAAACHDLGLVNGRENHHLDSGRIIRNDAALKQWFSPGQIEEMAQAAEDHRASGKAEPRSIYGKIIAEADRVIDPDTIIMRTLQFGQTHYPGLDMEEQITRAQEHLSDKYGYGGYLKLWIPWSDNAARLEALRQLIADSPKLYRRIRQLLFRI